MVATATSLHGHMLWRCRSWRDSSYPYCLFLSLIYIVTFRMNRSNKNISILWVTDKIWSGLASFTQTSLVSIFFARSMGTRVRDTSFNTWNGQFSLEVHCLQWALSISRNLPRCEIPFENGVRNLVINGGQDNVQFDPLAEARIGWIHMVWKMKSKFSHNIWQ